MHNHLIAHATPHILRTVIHVVAVSAAVGGLEWAYKMAEEHHSLEYLTVRMIGTSHEAGQAAQHLFKK